jgi:hypothetical protein
MNLFRDFVSAAEELSSLRLEVLKLSVPIARTDLHGVLTDVHSIRMEG